jgi:DNA-binding LytR/AlgR family response regulator
VANQVNIKIENIPEGSEPEVIIRSNEIDESILKLIDLIRAHNQKVVGLYNSKIHLIEPTEIYYFEAVDSRVFIYCREKVYESRLKLYQIEEEYETADFFRASKSFIINLGKIETLSPAFNGRFEALLKNGEKVIISRQYVPVLKKKLGV